MRLIACTSCHTQYDVSDVHAEEFPCRCGATLRNALPAPRDARVQRCASCGAALASEAEQCAWCRSAVERDPGRLGLLCPECYARNPERAGFCTHCGVEFRPQAVEEPGDAPECPCCGASTAPQALSGVWVHECPKCNGLWVPGEQFDGLIRRALESQAAPPSAGLGARREPAGPRPVVPSVAYRRCPVCRDPMHRKNFGRSSGVIVDWCGRHGTWLDADELQHIAEFVRRGGLEEKAAGGSLGLGGARSPQEVEAFLNAERMLAEERARQARRRARLEDGFDLGSSILELLRSLLR